MTRKSRLIEKMAALSSKEKAQVIDFFNKYPNYENRIDWNRKVLHYSDFEKVFALAEKSAKNRKREAKENPRLLFEKYNCEIICQTEDFLLAVPLDWDCAIFFNSYNCGGEGARWCIGDINNHRLWYSYAHRKNIFVLAYFTKRQPIFGRKIIIQYNTEADMFALWLQSNKEIVSKKHINLLFKSFDILSKIKLWGKMADYINMYSLLFKVIRNEMPIVSKRLWRKIYIPKYIINNSILEKWFDTEAVEVTIPLNVTSIGENAFMFCGNLTTINIPDGVTSIGESAFYFCEKLTAIKIPNSITSIGDFAFAWCENLTAINIPDSVLSIGRSAFSGCESLKSINIPARVTSIGKRAFMFCKNLTTINIPNSVTSIGEEAFYCCENLTTINIPDSVKSIGKKAFCDCENLVSVNIPKDARVARNAFKWCKKLGESNIKTP